MAFPDKSRLRGSWAVLGVFLAYLLALLSLG